MFFLYAQFFYFRNILLTGPRTVNIDVLDGYLFNCLAPAINFHKFQIAGNFQRMLNLILIFSLHH